jgi:hypothetical protein
MRSSFCLLVFSASMMLTLPSCVGFDIVGVPHQVPFNEAEFARYRAPGTGTVLGHLAIIGQDDHEPHLGDGCHISLLPVTSYTTEMVNREVANGQKLSASDPRLHKYLRFATADGRGNFVIPSVPSGDYYLTGLVEWPVGDDFEYQWACEKIHVGSGQTLQVQVSRNIHGPGHDYLVVWRIE